MFCTDGQPCRLCNWTPVMQPDSLLHNRSVRLCNRVGVGILLSRYVTGQIPMYNRSETTSTVAQPDVMDISRHTTGQDQLALLHILTAPDVQPAGINYLVAQLDNLDLSQCITGQAPLRNWIGLHADES